VRTGKARLSAQLDGTLSAEHLLEILDDTHEVPDDELPRTGVSLNWERQLSPLRIRAGEYGTRSSTVLFISTEGEVSYLERSFDPSGAESGPRARAVSHRVLELPLHCNVGDPASMKVSPATMNPYCA